MGPTATTAAIPDALAQTLGASVAQDCAPGGRMVSDPVELCHVSSGAAGAAGHGSGRGDEALLAPGTGVGRETREGRRQGGCS